METDYPSVYGETDGSVCQSPDWPEAVKWFEAFINDEARGFQQVMAMDNHGGYEEAADLPLDILERVSVLVRDYMLSGIDNFKADVWWQEGGDGDGDDALTK